MTHDSKTDAGALLPCPFCGSRSITMTYFNQPATRIAASCQACLAIGPTVDRYAEPFKHWNNRAPAQSCDAGTDGLRQAMEIVGNMRQSDAGRFDDPKYCGQRGCDRSDALYDAYVAIRAALAPTPAAGGETTSERARGASSSDGFSRTPATSSAQSGGEA